MWNTIEWANIHTIWQVLRRMKERKKVSEEMMAENFLNLNQLMYLQIQQAQQISYKTKLHTKTTSHKSKTSNTKTHTLTAEWQRENFESSKGKGTCYLQWILSRIISWFLIRNRGDQKAVDWSIQSAGGAYQLRIVSPPKLPFKNEGEIETSLDHHPKQKPEVFHYH